ncbi:MAG: saccharopine dehydrogenase NADP-binding domain-containing protein [Fluviicoccus sp.]|uniref:saccharopine dehydrogenase family protein n=1 Tax=Fluviicoccus sp. TaxID=2003552 RepID=UPI00271E23FE|nr:saccharopine dehydrogenase NADP-binding domain-containing protein [Fluviicoccus sp.]MDO8331023.1 saccharopine dehydrogenase NADP-binding domain-containing protein [Fluviicoccus sp.]
MRKPVLILGGYGNFGRRIATALATDPDMELLIAGRDQTKAAALAQALGAHARPVMLDHTSSDFRERLAALKPKVLIHTSGPFQGQDLHIVEACIAAGCHYVDIADGRDYVGGIRRLDEAARQAGVLVASGASSLPALSSAVVDEGRSAFSRLDSIESGISAGAKPPGLATMEGVLSYVGKPFLRLENGVWRTVHGWQDIVSRRYPSPLGRRWLGSCDVPDLDLFPERYPGVRTVVFRAGVGFTVTTLATWLFSWLVRAGLLGNLARWASPLHRLAGTLEPLGSVWSAMHVTLTGMDDAQQPATRTWLLLAGNNDGPNIPCFPAIALTRKLVRGEVTERGAMPCMGLLTVEEILTAIPGLDLKWACHNCRAGEDSGPDH